MVPYVFGATCQVVVSFSYSRFMWTTLFVSGLMYKINSVLGHLRPLGSPYGLITMLNYNELLSLLIRPFTLSLRLRIKISTGHIFIILLRSGGLIRFFNFEIVWLFVYVLTFFYILFEFGICGLQSFVFRLLGTQYCDEHHFC